MPPASAAASARARLLDLLLPVTEACGVDLEDISVTAAGRRSLVRVSVDADGGLDLDRIAEVSRRISEALDGDDASAAPVPGAYVLEVSSPGVERPLTEPRHWRRNVGRLVAVAVAGDGVTARIADVSASGVALDVDGVRSEVAFSDLGAGRVQVEFNRPDAGADGTSGDEEA